MKKGLMLVFAALIVAAMTGCGGGSSAKSKSSDSGVTDTTSKSESTFEVAPVESATNTTYTTSAGGDFPPAPPVSSLQTAQEDANSKL